MAKCHIVEATTDGPHSGTPRIELYFPDSDLRLTTNLVSAARVKRKMTRRLPAQQAQFDELLSQLREAGHVVTDKR